MYCCNTAKLCHGFEYLWKYENSVNNIAPASQKESKGIGVNQVLFPDLESTLQFAIKNGLDR